MVFSKLRQLMGKGNNKTVADQIKSQPDCTDDILELIDTLPLAEKVTLLKTGENLFSQVGWSKFINHLVNQGFHKQLTEEVKRNGSSLSPEEISVFTKLPASEVVELLVDLLAAKNEFIRFEAADAMIKLQDPLVVTRLLQVLGQPKQWIPARVTEILASYAETATKELIQAFDQAETDTQLLILEMLTQIGHPDAEILFLRCLVQEDPRLRVLAITGLGALGKGNEILTRTIKDIDPVVRLKTVQLLEHSEDPALYNYFWVALLDADWLVRCKAAETLIDRDLLPANVMNLVRESKDNPDVLTEIFKLTGDLNQEAFIWKN